MPAAIDQEPALAKAPLRTPEARSAAIVLIATLAVPVESAPVGRWAPVVLATTPGSVAPIIAASRPRTAIVWAAIVWAAIFRAAIVWTTIIWTTIIWTTIFRAAIVWTAGGRSRRASRGRRAVAFMSAAALRLAIALMAVVLRHGRAAQKRQGQRGRYQVFHRLLL
jgi:hypothetical protein